MRGGKWNIARQVYVLAFCAIKRFHYTEVFGGVSERREPVRARGAAVSVHR